MPAFPEAAKIALADTQLRRNLAHATQVIRTKRDGVVGELDDWEELRLAGAAIKDRVAAAPRHVPGEVRGGGVAAGAQVHWARDAEEANQIVIDLVQAAGADEVVKVKSMATQEMGMNEALAEAGIAALETDLAELIVQLDDDLPSHILVPAIHRNRAEIREIFLREMPDAPPDLTDEPRAPGRRRPGAPAAQVHVGESRDLRGELRDRRDRDARRRRVRGQRADVPDPARDADQRGRHREAAADLGRPGGVPAAAAPFVDRRADEPVHHDVDRGLPPTTARGPCTSSWSTTGAPARWPIRWGGRRCVASAVRPA